ncbi:hypothetical protein RFN28_32330 [Mesorhizobium sp. VK24D]|uniref:Uncharacterized protein n=1 Tax=Mesorhizobium album TaxID=3072314 RepID=A0ABU4Y841_9HYPH|nr:hypothetical protein [Mesorhizobium sp. VK24D]MDX8483104.1 hypothetical protein [Mesorhizobium sp. VK24D]
MMLDSRHDSRICKPAADNRATTHRDERPAVIDGRRATTPRL